MEIILNMNTGQEIHLDVMDHESLLDTAEYVNANQFAIAKAEVMNFDDEEPNHGFLTLEQLHHWIASRIKEWEELERISAQNSNREIPW